MVQPNIVGIMSILGNMAHNLSPVTFKPAINIHIFIKCNHNLSPNSMCFSCLTLTIPLP